MDPAAASAGSPALIADGGNKPGRIEGYDVARAIAVFGMVLVNYDIIFPGIDAYPAWYEAVLDFLFGRAAALFVMLAGVGLSLIGRRAYFSGDKRDNRQVRMTLFKRSFALLIMGLLFMQWWGADILHFYSIYLSAGALLLSASSRRLWGLVLVLLLFSSFLFYVTDGSPGLEGWIAGPGLLAGIIDDLLFSGYYSVFPWLGFLLIGMWIGKHEIISDSLLKRKILIWALVIIVAAEFSVRYAPLFLYEKMGFPEGGLLDMLLISNVFPVSPVFSISAAASSIIVIILSLSIARHRLFAKLTGPLACTGKLSLTIYITHIFIGFGCQRVAASYAGSTLYQVMTTMFPFGFCLSAIFISTVWCRYFARGPFEWLLRHFSSSA